MRAVDDQYRYDELEGFEKFDVKCFERKTDIWMSVSGSWINFSSEAKKIIYGQRTSCWW